MFPFNLSGPLFLQFYLCWGLAVAVSIIFLRRKFEGGQPPGRSQPRLLSHAYLIAYLRGGSKEAVAIAIASLVDRGLIKSVGANLGIAPGVTPDSARRELEQAVLERVQTCTTWVSALESPAVVHACSQYQEKLEAAGLLPNAQELQTRKRLAKWGVIVFAGLGVIKLIVALRAGHSNVESLFFLGLVGSTSISRLPLSARRTQRGDLFLADLRTFFAGLQDRAGRIRAGGASAEMALLAAVFGISALPASRFPFARQVFPNISELEKPWIPATCLGAFLGTLAGLAVRLAQQAGPGPVPMTFAGILLFGTVGAFLGYGVARPNRPLRASSDSSCGTSCSSCGGSCGGGCGGCGS